MTFDKRSKTLTSRTWPRKLSDSLSISDSNSRSTQRPKNTTPRTYFGAQKMLGSLRDLQAITGAGILVAGLVQLPGLVYYHQSLISCIWNLTLNSLWAAQTKNRNGANNESDIHDTARGVVVLISVLLSIVFQSWSNFYQWHNWDTEVSGLCYRYHGPSAEWLDWFWVAGLIIFAIHEFITLSSRVRRKLHKFLTTIDKTMVKIDSTYTERVDLFTNFLDEISHYGNTLNWLKALSKLIYTLSAIFRRLVKFLWFLFGLLVSAWATGHGRYGIETIFYIGFAVWNTFGIIDLKISNKVLIEQSDAENKWSFGQVLSLALLGTLVFNTIDAFGPEKRDSVPSIRDGNGQENN